MTTIFKTLDCIGKCKISPIPPECVRFCLRRMLGKITIEELRLIWGFEIEVAEPIFEAINSTPAITGIDDLDIRLTVEQLSMLIEKLSSFNQYQLNYFNKTMPDRAETISAIQRLNLDKGGDDTLLGSLVTSPVIFPADDFVKE